uniref:Uncharacterized protein n=1 Tax=Eutreptiella gymnastica TaxID=73025 RepID=A0A7S1J602_9EUGL
MSTLTGTPQTANRRAGRPAVQRPGLQHGKFPFSLGLPTALRDGPGHRPTAVVCRPTAVAPSFVSVSVRALASPQVTHAREFPPLQSGTTLMPAGARDRAPGCDGSRTGFLGPARGSAGLEGQIVHLAATTALLTIGCRGDACSLECPVPPHQSNPSNPRIVFSAGGGAGVGGG